MGESCFEEGRMLAEIAFLTAATVWGPCALSAAPDSMHGEEVTLVGFLHRTYHGPYLDAGAFRQEKAQCLVFPIFGPYPEFLIPGVDTKRIERSAETLAFLHEYDRVRAGRDVAPRLVKVTGILQVKKDFALRSGGKGNGYGWQGTLRTAVIVRKVRWAEG
jgi:hypothetical protein